MTLNTKNGSGLVHILVQNFKVMTEINTNVAFYMKHPFFWDLYSPGVKGHAAKQNGRCLNTTARNQRYTLTKGLIIDRKELIVAVSEK